LTHALIVISDVGLRLGLLATRTSVVVPLNESALLTFPLVQTGAVTKPELLFPDESAAIAPEVSSNFQYPTSPHAGQKFGVAMAKPKLLEMVPAALTVTVAVPCDAIRLAAMVAVN
jgi:hypothetical protein